AIAIVIVTGLLTRSVVRLQSIDSGLDRAGVVIATLAVPPTLSSDRARHLQFLNDVVRRLTSNSRIAGATPINALPFSGVGWEVPVFTAEGQDPIRAAANPSMDLEAVQPGYFE